MAVEREKRERREPASRASGAGRAPRAVPSPVDMAADRTGRMAAGVVAFNRVAGSALQKKGASDVPPKPVRRLPANLSQRYAPLLQYPRSPDEDAPEGNRKPRD